MRETIKEIQSITTLRQLQNFMSTHKPKGYSQGILNAISAKYSKLTKGRPSSRLQALYAFTHATYANYHPIWNKKPRPRQARGRAR